VSNGQKNNMPELKLVFSETFCTFSRKIPRKAALPYLLTRRATVKDIIESVGVPHPEVGEIWWEGRLVDFTFIPEHEGVVTVNPVSAPFDVTVPSLLRPVAFKQVRFIADINVGKLAILLRMLGLDTALKPNYKDADIARCSENDQRIVLSKDVGLLKHRRITHARYVRAIHPDGQLREVVRFFGLSPPYNAFSRCIRCNSQLIPVPKEQILHRLEPKTRKYFHRFKICPDCDRIFWKGSHHQLMKQRLLQADIRFSE